MRFGRRLPDPLEELLANTEKSDWEVLISRDHPIHERVRWAHSQLCLRRSGEGNRQRPPKHHHGLMSKRGK
jgi:hypothetical protein